MSKIVYSERAKCRVEEIVRTTENGLDTLYVKYGDGKVKTKRLKFKKEKKVK